MLALLDVSRIYHSAPSGTWKWTAICAGGLIAYLALVATAATVANHRDQRRLGRSDPWTHDDFPAHAGGPGGRPWEATARRKGVDADAQLAAAEAASEERSASTVGGR